MFIDVYNMPFGIKTKIKFINIDKIHKNVMSLLVLQMDTICSFSCKILMKSLLALITYIIL